MTKVKKVEPMRRQQHMEPWRPIFNRYELRAPLIKSNNPYQLLNKYSANAWHAVQASDRWRRLHKKQAENKAEAKAEAARQEEMKKNDEEREVSERLAAEQWKYWNRSCNGRLRQRLSSHLDYARYDKLRTSKTFKGLWR